MLESIDIYENSYEIFKRERINKIQSYIIILIVMILIFCYYFFCFSYRKELDYYLKIITNENENYVEINLPNKYIYFLEGADIFINDKAVKYEIVNVNNVDNNYKILLKLQLKLEPTIIKLKIILTSKTLFERFKGGMI